MVGNRQLSFRVKFSEIIQIYCIWMRSRGNNHSLLMRSSHEGICPLVGYTLLQLTWQDSLDLQATLSDTPDLKWK